MGAIQSLLPLLARQREVLTHLLDLVREERACLMSSALDRLEAIVQEQAGLLTEQSRLSTRVSYHLERLGAELQMQGRLSLAQAVQAAPAPDAAQMRRFYEDLSSLADLLQREGRVNWHLAQQALKYVDFTLKVIGQAQESPLPYVARPQTERARPVQILMDTCA